MIYSYLWVFFLFSFLGWCSEVIFAAMRQKRFVNRGFLNGPLCPIFYGLGVVLIDALTVAHFWGQPGHSAGWAPCCWARRWNTWRVFCWKSCSTRNGGHHSDRPHNLHGYICLKFSVVWALAGAIDRPVHHAWLCAAVFPHPPAPGLGAAGGAGRAAARRGPGWVTVVAIVGLNRKLRNLEDVTSKLRQGSDKLGKDLSKGAIALHGKRLAGKRALEKDLAAGGFARLKAKYEPEYPEQLAAAPALHGVPQPAGVSSTMNSWRSCART